MLFKLLQFCPKVFSALCKRSSSCRQSWPCWPAYSGCQISCCADTIEQSVQVFERWVEENTRREAKKEIGMDKQTENRLIIFEVSFASFVHLSLSFTLYTLFHTQTLSHIYLPRTNTLEPSLPHQTAVSLYLGKGKFCTISCIETKA